MDWAHFILQHDADDLARLALSRGRFGVDVPDFDLALTTLEVRRKLRGKVPEWYAVPGLRYPSRLSGEQCSSIETALYKASVASSVVSGYSAPAFEGIFAGNEYQMGPGAVKNGPFCGCPVPGAAIADLTGGLGVDSWAFSKVFRKVLYNEMQPALADAARHNFALLGAENITVRNCVLAPAGGSSAQAGLASAGGPGSSVQESLAPSGGPCSSVQEVLDGFQPDIIFLDPARRAADGRKVFRLEDCQPDVLQLLPELLDACPLVLLKLSPMADISLVCKQLGCVSEVHVVAAEGECKELLLLLRKGWTGAYGITVYESGAVARLTDTDHPLESATRAPLQNANPATHAPLQTATPAAPCSPLESTAPTAHAPLRTATPTAGEPAPDTPLQTATSTTSTPQEYPTPATDAPPKYTTPTTGATLHYASPDHLTGWLFEPGKALLKAGAFDWPGAVFGLRKLGRHTHLYVSESPIPEDLSPFGKCFRIKAVEPLNKSGMKAMAKAFPQAEVSARNVPLSSDELRRRLGVRSGGRVHLFGIHLDTAGNWLIATEF